MKLSSLSGEVAVLLDLGNALSLYAGIAALISFDFTVKEVLIMAIMLSFSDNLFSESAVASRVGVSWWFISGIRIGLAFIAATIINLTWSGGPELAKYGFISDQDVELTGWGEI